MTFSFNQSLGNIILHLVHLYLFSVSNLIFCQALLAWQFHLQVQSLLHMIQVQVALYNCGFHLSNLFLFFMIQIQIQELNFSQRKKKFYIELEKVYHGQEFSKNLTFFNHYLFLIQEYYCNIYLQPINFIILNKNKLLQDNVQDQVSFYPHRSQYHIFFKLNNKLQFMVSKDCIIQDQVWFYFYEDLNELSILKYIQALPKSLMVFHNILGQVIY